MKSDPRKFIDDEKHDMDCTCYDCMYWDCIDIEYDDIDSDLEEYHG